MTDSDESGFQPSTNASGTVWSLAAFSAAVFLCSVLGAKLLSQVIDKEELYRLAYDRSMRAVAAKADATTQVYSVVRSVGVDGMTTATIPLRGPAPVSPCGDQKPGEKSHH